VASNKNQHFVPRCYLKPFTLHSNGQSISLFNVDRQQLIPTAPVKNQCSGDYFYGENLILEKSLQRVEGEYALALSEILRPRYQLTDVHRDFLRDFWLLQYMRTEAASRRQVEIFEEVNDFVASDAHAISTSIRDAVRDSMRRYDNFVAGVGDVRVCLVRNRTRIPFITSDDPAVLANRWHEQDRRAANRGHGLQSSGALFFLPLSPSVLCVCYDGDVYSIPHVDGWIEAKREKDIFAFNQHQYFNCRSNFYFSSWGDGERLAKEFRSVLPRRPHARHRVDYAVFDRLEVGGKVFRQVDRTEAAQHSNVLIHTVSVFASPTAWPLLIGRRVNGVVYETGTGSGFLRRDTINFLGVTEAKKVRA
jgi:hypothetical protein